MKKQNLLTKNSLKIKNDTIYLFCKTEDLEAFFVNGSLLVFEKGICGFTLIPENEKDLNIILKVKKVKSLNEETNIQHLNLDVEGNLSYF